MPKTKLSPLANLAVEAAEEVKALDLKLLDVQKLTPMTDYMLICTGTSNRHVRSIAENVALRAKQAGYGHPRTQGAAQSEWVLVDLGGIIVHVMQLQARAFYQLEKLWGMNETTDEAVSTAPKKVKSATKKKTGGKKKAAGARKPARGTGSKTKKKPLSQSKLRRR